MNESSNDTAGQSTESASAAATNAPPTRAKRASERQASRPTKAPSVARGTLAQRDAQHQAALMAKQNADPKVKAIRADLQAQSEAIKEFNPSRQVPRREYDADGKPQSNSRTRARSAR